MDPASGLGAGLLAFVTLQRGAELVLARRNARRLLASGAVEFGRGHYGVIVFLHAAWLFGLWVLALGRPVHLGWAGFYLVLQVLRLWTIGTLKDRWTTRIIVLPGAPLIRSGPFRYLDHPNYAIVVAEIAVLPLAFGLLGYAIVFSILNAAVLAVRIREENRALRELSADAR